MSIDMEEFERVKIGSICDKVCSGGTPKSTISEYYDGNIPWLNTKEVDFNRIDKTERCITELGLNNSSAKWIAANCVIVAMYGATAGKVAISTIPLTTNQACCNLQINPNKADYRYVYYFIKSRYQHLASLANGGAQQNLNAQQIKDFEILLPSLDAQKRIADILWELDSKIELNRKINENLEQQAQAIFKSWFIDFEPFKDGKFVESELGMIPEGWKICKLGDVCEIVLGGTPSRDRKDFWNGDIAWINSGEVNNFRIVKPSEYITQLGFDNSATKLLPRKTTVIAITGATLGQISLLEIDSCANQSVVGIIENKLIGYEFIYPLIHTKIKELLQLQTGGAQQHINKGNVQDIRFIQPDRETMKNYSSVVRDMYELIGQKSCEIAVLTELRDTLLPKLMSGQITL
jgi:type I restriction enzyme S subunit